MKKLLTLALCFTLNGVAHAKVADVVSTNFAVAPVIDASEVTNINFNGTVPATFTGALDADDSTFNRPVSCSGLSAVGTAVAYDLVNITNTSANPGTITVFSEESAGVCAAIDSVFALYSAFTPATPLAGCLAVDDDTGVGNCSQLVFPLLAGESRTLVVTAFNNASAATGQFPYQINFAGTTGSGGGGGATITPVPVPSPAATPFVIPARTLPTASATVSFTLSASAASSTTCATTSVGYSVAPAALTTLPIATAVPFTVTQNSNAFGTFAGVVTCTNAAGATPASFVYNFTHTVIAAPVVAVPLIPTPALNIWGALALLASLGLFGAFAVRRFS
jgi:hypothetical protein